MSELTLSFDELAAKLSLTPAQLVAKRPRLQREHGFPRPLPGLGLVWSAAQVRAWCEQRYEIEQQERPLTITERARLQLEARYTERPQ